MIAGRFFLEGKAVLNISVYSVDYRFTSLSLGESSAKADQNPKIGNRITIPYVIYTLCNFLCFKHILFF